MCFNNVSYSGLKASFQLGQKHYDGAMRKAQENAPLTGVVLNALVKHNANLVAKNLPPFVPPQVAQKVKYAANAGNIMRCTAGVSQVVRDLGNGIDRSKQD